MGSRLAPGKTNDDDKFDVTLISSTALSHFDLALSRAHPLSVLVAQVSETAHIPAAQCRLCLRQSHSEDELQVWPMLNCVAAFSRLPGLQRCLGPVLVAAAASLIAAGMPVRLLELVLKEACDMAVHAAPFKDFAESEGTAPILCASYNTPDGLPSGRRVRVTATAGGRKELSAQVPSCMRVSHLVAYLRARGEFAHTELGTAFRHSGKTMCTYTIAGQRVDVWDARPICELDGFNEDGEVALTVDVTLTITLERETRPKPGRPFTTDSGGCLGATATSTADDAWSGRTVEQLLDK